MVEHLSEAVKHWNRDDCSIEFVQYSKANKSWSWSSQDLISSKLLHEIEMSLELELCSRCTRMLGAPLLFDKCYLEMEPSKLMISMILALQIKGQNFETWQYLLLISANVNFMLNFEGDDVIYFSVITESRFS